MEHLSITLVKQNGTLYPATNQDRVRLNAFTQLMPEGQKVTVYMSQEMPATHSLAQLAKVHATIKDLAVESGQDTASIKDLIKREANLVELDEAGVLQVKSFAKCTMEELSRAIQVAVNYADLLGIPPRT